MCSMRFILIPVYYSSKDIPTNIQLDLSDKKLCVYI